MNQSSKKEYLLPQKGTSYFETIENTLFNYQQNESNPTISFVDVFAWGYLAAQHEYVTPQFIFNKILQTSQLNDEKILTHQDKYNLYVHFSKDIKTEIDEYIAAKLQNPEKLPNLSMKKMQSQEERKLNQELIEQLKIEEDIEKDRNRKLKEKQSESMMCKICYEPLTSKAFTTIDSCSHVYHNGCLGNYAKVKIDDRSFPIKCPEDNCRKEVFPGDLYEVLNNTYMQRFEQYTFQSYVDKNLNEVSWCPTADCQNVFEKSDNIHEFKCDSCGIHYCLDCRVEFHKGQSCKEWRISNNFLPEDQKFYDFIKGRKFKQCTKCKYWVEKISGCDNMNCRCGFGFCYRCGQGPCICQKKINRRGGINPFEGN